MRDDAPISRPRIVQCLCPKHHVISAVTYETLEDDVVLAGMRRHIEACLQADAIDAWCPVCGASAETWRYETAVLKPLAWVKVVRGWRRYDAERQAIIDRVIRMAASKN